MTLAIVVAAAQNGTIGESNSLPWHIPEDMAMFRRLTRGHAVIVGRSTNDSIIERLGRCLPDRYTVLLSRNPATPVPADGELAATMDEALAAADRFRVANAQEDAFVIGGSSVYEQALPLVDRIYLTRVHQVVEGDTRLPAGWLDGFALQAEDEMLTSRTGVCYSFCRYIRVPGGRVPGAGAGSCG